MEPISAADSIPVGPDICSFPPGFSAPTCSAGCSDRGMRNTLTFSRKDLIGLSQGVCLYLLYS